MLLFDHRQDGNGQVFNHLACYCLYRATVFADMAPAGGKAFGARQAERIWYQGQEEEEAEKGQKGKQKQGRSEGPNRRLCAALMLTSPQATTSSALRELTKFKVKSLEDDDDGDDDDVCAFSAAAAGGGATEEQQEQQVQQEKQQQLRRTRRRRNSRGSSTSTSRSSSSSSRTQY